MTRVFVPGFTGEDRVVINQMFTKGENRLYMNNKKAIS